MPHRPWRRGVATLVGDESAHEACLGLLRRDDLGLLWEHYVLNELHAQLQTRRLNYWRDRQGHEVDFVLARRYDRLQVQFVSLDELVRQLTAE
jgi:predicted AAA+ superfamily ATPase